MQFTEEQKNVIDHTDGFVLCVACPGSGKTTTMLERIHNIISKGTPPEKILMITFSKASTEDMRSSFQKRYNIQGVTFSTIHSLCLKMLREESFIQGRNVLEEKKKKDFFWNLLKKETYNRDEVDTLVNNVISEIGYMKNAKETLQTHKPWYDYDMLHYSFEDVVNLYEIYKVDNRLLDYDDMLVEAEKMLAAYPNIRAKWQELYQYVIVDEFQDTNKVQANILYLLTQKYKNVCVVGDDDQAIYGFRAADSSVMLNFERVFKGTTRYTLSTNFRSKADIVNASRNLISYNKTRFPKNFYAGRTDREGGTIDIKRFYENEEQDTAVINKIKMLHNKGVSYDEMAILYRINAQGASLVSLLDDAGIPYHIQGGMPNVHDTQFFKDIVSYYRLAYRIGDVNDSLLNILNHPSRYLKTINFQDCDMTRESIQKCCRKQGMVQGTARYDYVIEAEHKMMMLQSKLQRIKETDSLQNMVMEIFDNEYFEWVKKDCKSRKKDYRVYQNYMSSLIREADRFENMEDWLEYAENYMNKLKSASKQNDGLTLSTFHSAKGLEWEHVIIINAEKGDYYMQSTKTVEDEEAERRVFYVAVTRAKDELLICYTGDPSPFIFEIRKPSS